MIVRRPAFAAAAIVVVASGCAGIPQRASVTQPSDPQGLLEGTGKRHRYVQINQPSDLDRAGIEELLKAAREAANARRGV